jgi:hypothetical protein
MAKMTPTPDVVDDDDYHYAPLSWILLPKANHEEDFPTKGVNESSQRPGRSCSHSRSSSSKGSTKYKQALKASLLKRLVAKVMQL